MLRSCRFGEGKVDRDTFFTLLFHFWRGGSRLPDEQVKVSQAQKIGFQ
jgi:hypothetical protein